MISASLLRDDYNTAFDKMKTNRERSPYKDTQSGNALIYVLIAIALFAALSFTLARQGDDGEASDMNDSRAELYATDIISYAAQAKAAVDQMLFTGTQINELDFMPPTAAGFNAGTQIQKTRRVYHPEGGGLNPGNLPAETTTSAISDPPAGWYMGRFNNVEWTNSNAEDVILVAFQIKQKVCENINMKIKGSAAIPVLTDFIKEVMIDDTLYGSGTNTDLSTDPTGSPICATCHKIASLCVQDQGLDAYAFYTVIADQ